MSELKPCPLCGSANVQISPYDGGKTAICMNCFCRAPMYRGDDALEKSITAWNRRAQPANEANSIEIDAIKNEPLTCESCANFGEVVIEQGISPYCPSCGSGEYMHNPDEAENSYCGQCGTKLIWPERSEDDAKV